MDHNTIKTSSGIVRKDIFDDNFKTVSVSLEFFVPLDRVNASYISLLCAVLRRGNSVYGEMDKIGEFLDENYGASFGVSTSKKGDLQRFAVTAAFIDDRFTLEGETVSKNIISLIYATLFSPCLENGAFKTSFVTTRPSIF